VQGSLGIDGDRWFLVVPSLLCIGESANDFSMLRVVSYSTSGTVMYNFAVMFCKSFKLRESQRAIGCGRMAVGKYSREAMTVFLSTIVI
jgi:hypothetical protein